MSTKQKVVTSNGTIRTKKRKLDTSDLQLYSLCAIPLIYVFIMSYIPMFGIVLAFKNFNIAGGIWGSPWVGFRNFTAFFQSIDAWRVIRNTIGNNALFIVTTIISALAVAILLFELKSRMATKIFQTVLITPHFMSWVVVAYMVMAILNTRYGYFNQVLMAMGVCGSEGINWYAKPGAWPIILTICSVWKSVGMDSVIYYASLMGIDSSLFEAADVDGANKWQKIWNITLPSLVPILTINTILKIGGIFNADFGLFFNVTKEHGGGMIFETTDVISTYSYRLFKAGGGSYGASTAVSLMQSIVGIIMVVLTNAGAKKIDPSLGLF